jgi:hypothetical protein
VNSENREREREREKQDICTATETEKQFSSLLHQSLLFVFLYLQISVCDWRVVSMKLRDTFADLSEDMQNFALGQLTLMNHFS